MCGFLSAGLAGFICQAQDLMWGLDMCHVPGHVTLLPSPENVEITSGVNVEMSADMWTEFIVRLATWLFLPIMSRQTQSSGLP